MRIHAQEEQCEALAASPRAQGHSSVKAVVNGLESFNFT
jgi:hypothetical protein